MKRKGKYLMLILVKSLLIIEEISDICSCLLKRDECVILLEEGSHFLLLIG